MSRFDPRGRANRALLIGVSEYETLPKGNLPGVAENLTELSEALKAGRIFGDKEVVTCSPVGVDAFTTVLNKAVEEAEGLLLFYFAGHGAVPSGGDELWLQMRNAHVVKGVVFQGAQSWTHVLSTLASSKAKQIVVVLDCCHAGNAGSAWEALEHKGRISQLMCVQANHEIGAGPGTKPTPFTEQLVRILKEGVGKQGGDVSFRTLSEEIRARMSKHRTKRSEVWEPQSRPGTSGTDVLLATDIPLPPPPSPPPLPRWRRKPFLVAVAAALVTALVLGVYFLTAVPGPPSCAPPLELRLLTDPDIEPTVRKAAASYMTSDANRTSEGCRRSGITTYSAGAADAVVAFRDNSTAWQEPSDVESTVNPQRDIGAQPDIWIPSASADVRRAASKSGRVAASMGTPVPLASSPIVLAVPKESAKRLPGQREGRKLADLVTAFIAAESGAQVRRADPEFTAAALLATEGLYGAAGSGKNGEQQVAHVGLPALTGRDLLCQLPDLEGEVDDRTAAIVPEHLLTTGVDCEKERRAPRVALYPADVPGLDPVFVRVTWKDADLDAKARSAAADGFREWLTGKGGAAIFGADGFRGAVDGETGAGEAKGPSGAGAGTLPDPDPLAGPATGEELDEVLDTYRNASGPGRVLFLLDSSGSMRKSWEGPSGAPGMLKQSLAGLGKQDVYGVWAVADTGPGPYTEVLRFGSHTNTEARDRIDENAQVRDAEADPYRALSAALDDMAEKSTDDRGPRLIVYLTDDEDNDRLTGAGLSRLLASAKDKEIPVVVVSLKADACLKDRPDRRIADASGGRCLDGTSGDVIAALSDEVARTGSGDQR
ncbi:substrate-binding domain-containing protein [Streptomyces sp. NBC_01498]|uniref:substrate-binding domain-containing protein n=1 Tax=Streptomyces sp. NBC_01498 TaxID=2975870 RepID=UPI002E7C429B|nr:substrate-binding domain-containing protein [Streptomyces sp. NBC_01498]WTL24201.1 substrate-binding domain-containing protein [Streptomyces sp. NBC_01498]